MRNKNGRPTKYKSEFAEQTWRLCLLGATDSDIADFFEVSESTINLWKKEHPEFSESVRRGKKEADARVAEKLYSRAIGYSHPDLEIRVVKGRVRKIKVEKHYPPDTTAAAFWLKNRDKDNWREKQHLDIDLNDLSEEDAKRVAKYILQLNEKNRR